MLKNILELNGAQELNKSEQKKINGSGLVIIDCSTPNICRSPFAHFCRQCLGVQ